MIKYEHRFCNTEFGQLKLTSGDLALVCTLLLRGAQTPGELRIRCARLHEFTDVADVEQSLKRLATREDGPFVVQLAREPGKRESRYMHLFGSETTETLLTDSMLPADESDLAARISELEREMQTLKQQVAALQSRVS